VLSSPARMRRAADFGSTVRRGRRGVSPTVVVHRIQAPGSTAPPVVGFVVSTAVGNATVRNQVRRRLRHLVRDRWSTIPPGTRLVVRATPASSQADYQRLSVDLSAALEQAAR
jgi:ribonuclease P protein component